MKTTSKRGRRPTEGETVPKTGRNRLLLLSALVLASLTSVECQRWNEFTGDGTFTDHGWDSFQPRYEVTFPLIPLSAGSASQYRMKGFPSEEFTLELWIAGTESLGLLSSEMDAVYDHLKEARLTVRVSFDSPNSERASYEGMLVGDWVPSWSGQLMYYIDSLSGLQFDTDQEVDLLLEVRALENVDLSEYAIEPRLVAGGREFS